MFSTLVIVQKCKSYSKFPTHLLLIWGRQMNGFRCLVLQSVFSLGLSVCLLTHFFFLYYLQLSHVTYILFLKNILASFSLCSLSLKWANPGLFLVYFHSFQSYNTIFTTNQCANVPPVGMGFELTTFWLLLTTRPGLPPFYSLNVFSFSVLSRIFSFFVRLSWIFSQQLEVCRDLAHVWAKSKVN